MNTNTLVQLYRAYSHPSRFFHNLKHIADCFFELNRAIQVGIHIDDEEAVRFALWFHDEQYDGRRSDNEETSALDAYEAAIHEGYNEEFANRVKRMVLVTKHSNQYPCTTTDEELICDIDLTSLAANNFPEITEQIRKEYAFVPEELFRSERKKILVAFNLRQPIYRTQYFQDKYEAKAHDNLRIATS